jgi:hypothetical protein
MFKGFVSIRVSEKILFFFERAEESCRKVLLEGKEKIKIKQLYNQPVGVTPCKEGHVMNS